MRDSGREREGEKGRERVRERDRDRERGEKSWTGSKRKKKASREKEREKERARIERGWQGGRAESKDLCPLKCVFFYASGAHFQSISSVAQRRKTPSASMFVSDATATASMFLNIINMLILL